MKPDFAKRMSMVDEFIVCPKCGSSGGTIEIDEGTDEGIPSNLRGVCTDCDYTTPWVYDP